MPLLLTLNIFNTSSSVSIVDLEQVNAGWFYQLSENVKCNKAGCILKVPFWPAL